MNSVTAVVPGSAIDSISPKQARTDTACSVISLLSLSSSSRRRVLLGRAAQRPGPGERFSEHLTVGRRRHHQLGAAGGLDPAERHQVRPHRIVGDAGACVGWRACRRRTGCRHAAT